MAITFSNAKHIAISSYLSSLGIEPTKIRANEHWYHSPFRSEKTASFKVDIRKNLWYDHGIGEGGTIVDLGCKIHNCTQVEFLEKLSLNNYIHTIHIPKQNFVGTENKLKILAVTDLRNVDLINYINSRGISTELATLYCKEIQFQIDKKSYHAIGFPNRTGGFELRNRWFKGSSSPKDISLLNNNSPKLCVLEGFIDFLSIIQISSIELKSLTQDSDFLILNSVSLLNRNVNLLKSYSKVGLFLDNDLAGKEAKRNLSERNISFTDYSTVYSLYKDVNEYLTNSTSKISTSLRAKNFRVKL